MTQLKNINSLDQLNIYSQTDPPPDFFLPFKSFESRIYVKMICKLRQPVNALTHLIAVLLSVAGLVVLLCQASRLGRDAWHMTSFSVYGASLILLYSASTLYHSLNVSQRANDILRQLDHAMIYVLIAGTYTPVCLVVLRGGWGWSLFGVNWGLAIVGLILKLSIRNPPKPLVVVLFTFYILMGWVIVIAFVPLMKVLPSGGIFWLILGGGFYTLGAIILNFKWLKIIPGVFEAHELWHLFVMAGSASHFWMMFKYVLYLK